MKTLPVLNGGKRIGETLVEEERLYVRLEVRVPSRQGLWCAWAIGERGEVRVGTLEPVNGQSVISRRFSKRFLTEAGALLRVEVRPLEGTENAQGMEIQPSSHAQAGERNDGAELSEAWRRTGTARLFRSMRFQRPLRNVREALTRRDGERRRVALIQEEGAPFPIPELFCLASLTRIGARDYWVFTFDRREWPVLSSGDI